jgi:hypothetical protein
MAPGLCLDPENSTGKPQNEPHFHQTQTVTGNVAVTNYAAIAKPSPTPTLFGVSLAQGLIYCSSNIIERMQVPYNLQPIVRELLTENPHLLD